MPNIFVSPQTGSEYILPTQQAGNVILMLEEPFVCYRVLGDDCARIRVQWSDEARLEELAALLNEQAPTFWACCHVKDGDHLSVAVLAENKDAAIAAAEEVIAKFRRGARAAVKPTMKSWTGATYTIHTDPEAPVFVAYRATDSGYRVRVHGEAALLEKANRTLNWGAIKNGDHISVETEDLADTLASACAAVETALTIPE